MPAIAALLPCGTRLHLQHGPIDLIIGAVGERQTAFAAAKKRFTGLLEELVAELPALRAEMTPATPRPNGEVALRMDAAVRPCCDEGFVTRMAAVAGGVADTVLAAMLAAADLDKAYVNNGGDIALHLTRGQRFSMAMAGHDGNDLGRIVIGYDDPIRGIATSGRHGRSLSLGIADSVTVLARNAATADVAATLIANAVDLPRHSAITRVPANTLDADSDLGDLPVVTRCARLAPEDRIRALHAGKRRAQELLTRDLITGAAIFLQGDSVATFAPDTLSQRMPEHA
ncbi:UPF0280 family protein [uncultured Roseovarius sp.]|uniref:UPF0280 family protein n=1 Tax=uncultured Roseovarius sp. TaxID=293344 RepID=UPI002618B722|nr:UPF0280 family protein [uncultured Roseovarius sp.]